MAAPVGLKGNHAVIAALIFVGMLTGCVRTLTDALTKINFKFVLLRGLIRKELRNRAYGAFLR